ncbi:MAG: hypothetical protein JSW56_10520 [Deltaproteobacteria bacterium]|nr:MAG: hypothetical protein JSW56_10520 [Deltaproteobacteria bacterium]
MLGTRGSVLITILILFLLSWGACSRDTSRVTGKYMAQTGEGEQSMSVILELRENGTGSWATEEDNVDFKWEMRGEEILFHTKSGGVIVGNIGREGIEIYLPGAGVHSFKKIRR